MERFTNYYRAKGSYSRTGFEAKKAAKGDKAEDREVGTDSVVNHFASMTPGQDSSCTDEKAPYPQTEGVEIEEAFSDKQIKMAYGIINDPRWKGGNMTAVVRKIEGIAKGLSNHPGVKSALRRTNEEVEKLDELSSDTLASYKKKAGADASAADKAGDFKRGNKRFSGIMRATKKEFNKANESVELDEASPMIKPPQNEFAKKADAFAHAKKNGGKVMKKTFTHPTSGQQHVSYVVKEEVELDEASHVVHITSTDKSGKKEMRTGHVVAQSKADAVAVAKKHYQDQGHTIHAVHYGPKRTPVKEETMEEGMVTDKDSMIAAKLAKLKKAGRINQSEWLILNRMRSKNPDGALSRINMMMKNMQNEDTDLEEALKTDTKIRMARDKMMRDMKKKGKSDAEIDKACKMNFPSLYEAKQGTAAKYAGKTGVFGGKYSHHDRAIAMKDTQKFSKWREKQAAKRHDQHMAQDPKMAKAGYAQNIVDTDKAQKKAAKKGLGKQNITWQQKNSVKREQYEIDEKTLTPAEMKKREEIAQAMERENPGMPMDKKMAIATAQAKKVAEELTPAQKAQRLKMITKVGNRVNKRNADAEKRAKRDAMRGIRKDKDYMDENTLQSFKSYISEAKVDVAAIAKELETYAKKSGGIDKKSFMDLVAQMKRTNKLPSKKDVMDMDTDPREFVLGLIYGHSDSATLKKHYGVSM